MPACAQAALQKRYPGAIALFMAGCGADANPEPWGSPAIAEKHGQTLADEVERVLGGGMLKPVAGKLSTQFTKTGVPASATVARADQRVSHRAQFPGPPGETHARNPRRRGELLKGYDAPISVWQLGES